APDPKCPPANAGPSPQIVPGVSAFSLYTSQTFLLAATPTRIDHDALHSHYNPLPLTVNSTSVFIGHSLPARQVRLYSGEKELSEDKMTREEIRLTSLASCAG